MDKVNASIFSRFALFQAKRVTGFKQEIYYNRQGESSVILSPYAEKIQIWEATFLQKQL